MVVDWLGEGQAELSMAVRRFPAKHGIVIVRDAMRQDLLFFAIPAFVVWVVAVVVTFRGGNRGLWGTVGEMFTQPGSFFALPLHTIIGTILFVVGLGIAIVAQATLRRG